MSKLALHGGTPVRSSAFTRWPIHGDAERIALLRVLESGNWGGYPSPNVEATAFARAFAEAHGAAFGVCAANGTVTLQLALRAAGISRGDEVIVPPLTFVASAAAAIYNGATPVFADVRPENYTLSPESVEASITSRTRAIICVHLGASVCDLDRLLELCRKHDLILIEDCAHMHGAAWRDRGIGSWGDFGSFSFQSSKLMTAGEGGIILTNEPRYEKRLQSLVNCGRREMLYGDADIAWLGHNYRITELQAAMLRAQLERLTEQGALRAVGYAALDEGLARIPGVSILEVDPRVTRRTGYQYIFKLDADTLERAPKDRILAALRAEGIPADEGYDPLNRRHELLPGDSLDQWYDTPDRKPKLDLEACPNAARASVESIWLPHPIVLGGHDDIADVLTAVEKVMLNLGEIAR